MFSKHKTAHCSGLNTFGIESKGLPCKNVDE
jgi:hypothetical protein